MADAFAAMLAEEQGEFVPAQGQYAATPIELSDEVIDRIAARVADRLTRGLLGQNLTRTVSEVSERLIREEIERIRFGGQPKNS
ncbi:MAG: hypothetical protein H0T71_12810 [Acidobacteria bacterium]|nr:hypothetical protein [Acidobacteriota bacterium]